MSGFVVDAPARPTLAVRGQAARFPVRRVYCIGRNYLAHIREMGEADEREGLRVGGGDFKPGGDWLQFSEER